MLGYLQGSESKKPKTLDIEFGHPSVYNLSSRRGEILCSMP